MIMSPGPIIYRSLEQLRSQLRKLEPRKIHRRIGPGFTLVFAIDYLDFDPRIPILKERHLKERNPEEGQPKEVQEVEERQGESHLNGNFEVGETSGVRHQDERPIKKFCSEERLAEETHPGERNAKKSDQNDQEHLDEPTLHNGHDGEDIPEEGHLSEADELTQDDSPFVDRLILTGPEEDEFRQYDNDDDEETVISRNRKKISTEAIIREKMTSNPLARPNPPVQPARTAAHLSNGYQPQSTRESPRQDLPGQLVPTQNDTPQQPIQTMPLKEVTIADINKFLEQKNLLVVHKELEQHMEKLPPEEARLTLRRAVFACLERDETFMLLKFIKLVFEINYNNDPKFWDELIGKLKRKNNPHAKCFTFRSEVDPKLVLQNYQSIIKQIGEHFERTNPTLTLPWLTFVYVRDACKPPPTPIQQLSLPAIENASSTSLATTPVHVTSKAQENLDPEKLRHVLEVSAGINKKEFRITIPRRQATFSSKLLVRRPNPIP